MSLRLRVGLYVNPGVSQVASIALDKPLKLVTLHFPICQMVVITVLFAAWLEDRTR